MPRPLDYAEELASTVLASHPAGVRKRQHQIAALKRRGPAHWPRPGQPRDLHS
jgi:hypothetical protein